MGSGGARSHSGPAKDPGALRRDRGDDQAGWTTLDPAGRKGKAPTWPLSQASARERTVWTAEWKRPQAIEWEKRQLQVPVAMYVRSLVEAEARGAAVNARTLVKQWMEELGISMSGMARNGWRIGEKADDKNTKKSRPVRKAKFTVHQGGGETE